MKALLVTLTNYEHYNYGNTLQCYAANKVLADLGLETDTLCAEDIAGIHLRNITTGFFHSLTGYRFSCFPNYWKQIKKRNQRFRAFEKTYFSMLFSRDLDRLSRGYDCYVTGSDQVWNARWYDQNPLYPEIFLLSFTQCGRKVCMMPSFGEDRVPEAWIPLFQDNLVNFPHISVREDQGRDIVKELTGRDAQVLVDPTLLLEGEEWKKLEQPPEEVDCSKPYILTYFLEEMPEEAGKQVRKIAEEKGLSILNMDSESEHSVFTAGPAEFLYLFSHAQLVVTNSFHACVFSFLFRRPFLVYERKGMMSRIHTLLSTLGLERKLVGSGRENDIWEKDYRVGEERIQLEREKAIAFLKSSLYDD